MWSHRGRLTALIGGCALAACSFDTKPIPPSRLTPGIMVEGGRSGSIDGGPQAGSNVGGGGSASQAGSSPAGGAGAEAGRAGTNPGGGGRSGTGSAGRGGTSGGPPDGFCHEAGNDGQPCDDGLFCTTGETCQDRTCQGGGATDCSASGNACNEGVCDPLLDFCVPQPLPDGTACAEELTCTAMGVCEQGLCSARECAIGGTCDLHCPLGCNCGTLKCEGADDCKARCGSTPCEIDCKHATRCNTKCEQGGSCTILCNEAGTCASECQTGSLCPKIDCTNTGDCRVKCVAGSTCAIDCRNAVDCSQIECETGAQCLLACGDNEDCGFKVCYDDGIVPMDCGNGVIGCPFCP